MEMTISVYSLFRHISIVIYGNVVICPCFQNWVKYYSKFVLLDEVRDDG